MDLPKRTKQQKSEAQSYAILLYKLRDLGIFRNLTGNDYGIDFELELVNDEQVTARTVKIQVKSAKNLRLRKDETPSVGGVKQSTLRYWCELGLRTNVIAYAVDLKTETIYVTWDLFWQAAAKIDGANTSKSIDFRRSAENSDAGAKAVTILSALMPNAADQIYAHTLALRHLRDFLEMLGDAYQYDPGTEINRTAFTNLLEVCKILLWGEGEFLWTDKEDRKYWTSFSYWEEKSAATNWNGVVCYTAKPILATLLPALINILKRYKKQAIAAKYYLSHRHPQYLELVYETRLPDDLEVDALIKWGDKYDYHGREPNGRYFVETARAAAPDKTAKKVGNKNGENGTSQNQGGQGQV